MDPLALDNENPTKYETFAERKLTRDEMDDQITDEIDAREVFDLIRNIKDPEHPLTLEELHVLELSSVVVKNDENEIRVLFTPTVNHCTMAQLIGLAIRVKLLRSLPARFKVSVKIYPGSHIAEDAVNKQLADKERVAAAMENSYLISAINGSITHK